VHKNTHAKKARTGGICPGFFVLLSKRISPVGCRSPPITNQFSRKKLIGGNANVRHRGFYIQNFLKEIF